MVANIESLTSIIGFHLGGQTACRITACRLFMEANGHCRPLVPKWQTESCSSFGGRPKSLTPIIGFHLKVTSLGGQTFE